LAGAGASVARPTPKLASTRANERWWPDRAFEHEHVQPEQEARFEADAWEESIEKYLRTASKVTIGQVAREALHIDVPKLGRAEQNRIAAAMQRLDWKRQPKKDWQGNRWWSR
jgi:predicted P-loop ATPase